MVSNSFSYIMSAQYNVLRLNEDSLTLDDNVITVYHKWRNPELRPIWMMAYPFIKARQCYYNFTCSREKPNFAYESI